MIMDISDCLKKSQDNKMRNFEKTKLECENVFERQVFVGKVIQSFNYIKMVEVLEKDTLVESETETVKEETVKEERVEGKVEEKKKEVDTDIDEEFMEEMKAKPLSFYFNMRDIPDIICKKYLPDLRRRWKEEEDRVYHIEKIMMALNPPDKSVQEDRFEILGELLDKAAQGFEIWDDHEHRNMRLGHRLVLESKLLSVIVKKFDIICKTVAEFDKIGGDRDAAMNEREWLRYEIRQCDMEFAETHEKFLKSYLDMDW